MKSRNSQVNESRGHTEIVRSRQETVHQRILLKFLKLSTVKIRTPPSIDKVLHQLRPSCSGNVKWRTCLESSLEGVTCFSFSGCGWFE